jgi:hypothetical protein
VELQEYWQAIRQKVCAKCLDGDGYGNCRLDPSLDCGVLEYLPKIVEAVSRVKSKDINDYVVELRGMVCTQCKYQKADGNCDLRKEIDCALDRYFPMIIDAIEEVQSSMQKGK